MEFQATIQYKGAPALYTIVPEGRGFFEAYLSNYEGSDMSAPPKCIFMIRGVGHWSGSIDDPEVLYQLGCIIEKEMKSQDFILPYKDLMKIGLNEEGKA